MRKRSSVLSSMANRSLTNRQHQVPLWNGGRDERLKKRRRRMEVEERDDEKQREREREREVV